WLSRISWWAGERDGAETAAVQAVAVLDGTGDDALLAMALSNKMQLDVLAGRDHEAAAQADRVVALSRDHPAIRAHALTNLGLALSRIGDPAGPATLEESLRVALAAGEPEHACRAYLCLAGLCLDSLGLAEAERWLAEGIEFAEGSEFLVYSR